MLAAPLDRVVFESATARVGAFRCSARDPRFHDSGPTEQHLVVFPRTSVWIRHVDSAAFLAEPRIVTVYNRGQEYRRIEASSDGDRSDWFAVTPEIALAIAQELDPRAAGDRERPYRVQWSTSDLDLYLRQRALFLRMERGAVEPLEAEEAVFEIVARVLERAHGVRRPPHSSMRATEAHRDLVQRARAELARDIGAQTDVTLLASRLQVSPYHLCRVFRATTGMTLHAYRLDLRCRVALERLSETRGDISRVALELGFSSHSHFTATLRRQLGITPSQVRRALGNETKAVRVDARIHPTNALSRPHPSRGFRRSSTR
ncbi:MAG TPA: AraC family transcriptional regulator [Gemmatimonadaceae bacterium]|nr:AraC family transcriptional regulator [Gemmatimonadaceae bacterium]